MFLSGCATVPAYKSSYTAAGMPGIYHRIEKGQTLWNISRIYSIDLDELARANRITDVTRLETGQLIFIPRKEGAIAPLSHYAGEDFIWPVRGNIISGFGQNFDNMINKGINIQPFSSHDVLASRSGRVVFCNENFPGYGKTIIIEHKDGFMTVYARNSQIYVKPGDYVQKGSRIGQVQQNRYLHFEVRKGHVSQNPVFYLP